jgi:nickel-dependent lactate racemase
MQSINLLSSAWYRDQTVSLNFPDHWEVDVIGDQALPALSPEDIRNSLLSPIASQPLFELATNHRYVAILIDDLTRPTPTAEILPSLLEELFKGGIYPGQVTIVIAAGTHAPASTEAIQKKIGTRLPAGIQIISHDGQGAMTYLGKTKSGTPLYLNPVVMECDLRIGLGCIYPHPVAGFSGGAKALVPGVAGVETIRYLHDNFQGPDQRGGNLDNEFRVEIEQIAAQIGLNFVVNATLNQQRQISGIFAGDMIQAFRRGVDYARQVYAVDVRSDTDIIIADMYPFDVDLQFAADRGMWPLDFASKDSSRVILASCPAGLGSHLLFPLQNSLRVRLKRRLRYFGWRDIKSLPYHLAAVYRLISRRSLPLIMVSSGLNTEQLKSVFPSGVLYPDWANARASLEQKYTSRRVKVAVYRCAPLMLPRENPLTRR